MALHELTDPQVIALRALLGGGLNAELEEDAGEPVVRSTLGYPASVPGRVAQLQLPALAVWRLEEQVVERTMRFSERLVTFRIDYIAPATPLELIDTRWPLLQAVWSKCLDLICAGHHPDVEEDARLLVNAGFTEIVVGGRWPRVSYLVPSVGEAVYPSFQAEIRAQHREELDLSGLPALSLETRVYPVGLPADERATYAAEIHGAGNDEGDEDDGEEGPGDEEGG